MRKIIATTFVTLDGVMEAPELWSMPFWSEQAARYKRDELLATGALLLGRRTYEEFAAAWPTMSDQDISEQINNAAEAEELAGMADRMNSLPKYVVSTTLREPLEWNNSTLISGDVVAELKRLKAEPGQDIGVHGSAGVVSSLTAADLIDEYRLMVFPVVYSTGKHLFHEGLSRSLKLVSAQPFESGVVVLTYTVDGAQLPV